MMEGEGMRRKEGVRVHDGGGRNEEEGRSGYGYMDGGRNEEEGRSGYMMEGEGMRRKEGVGT